MDKNEFKELLENYLYGNLSPEKRALLQNWYDSFGESEDGVPGMETEEDLLALKDELYQRIHNTVKPEKSWERPIRTFPSFRWATVAALFVFILGTSIWLYIRQDDKLRDPSTSMLSPKYHEVKTGVKQIKKVDLPDGSILFVNANSIIRIHESQSGDKREVFLAEGEAYFEVARDSLKPFIVQTPVLKVEVLGTAFNVKSYSRLDDVRVGVQRGRVRVSNSLGVLDELSANRGLSYRKEDGRTERIRLLRNEINSWTKGIVSLQKADFGELAQTLLNLYGVRLEYTDKKIADHHYNITIHANRPLKETMGLICDIHKTKYRRENNVITIYP